MKNNEGCEYNLLKEDNNTLKKFKRIQIEYHYGYEKLKEKLEEAGFTVSYSTPEKVFNTDATGTEHGCRLYLRTIKYVKNYISKIPNQCKQ